MYKKNLNLENFFIIFLYLTLLISFYFGENSTGGALIDYPNQKEIVTLFSKDFKETILNYDNFSTRHSPVLLIFLSFGEKLGLNDMMIRLFHLHLCLLLPLFFYKCLKLKFKEIDKKILILISGLIFLSPTFRTLAIWPDSRLLGLLFFTLSIYFFLKFNENYYFKYSVYNIIFYTISSYISPNFSVFAIFFLYNYFFISKVNINKIIIILFLNLIFSLPAFYYLFILDIFFLNKSAAIGINNENYFFFTNISNNILISLTITFFYLIPFIIKKIIIINKQYDFKNLIICTIITLYLVLYFNYNYQASGGGVFFKFSNYVFNNNILFYLIAFISILILLHNFLDKNLLLFLLIILNNPQYTLYHKYFDPFILIMLFTLFKVNLSLKKKKYKDFIFIYGYFIFFLIISNIKTNIFYLN
jgi:hypothetical protein